MFRLICLLYLGVLSNAQEKCKVSDVTCMLNLSKVLITRIFSESNELDPLHHDLIEGNISGVKYELLETTVTGFKNCQVDTVKPDFLNKKFDIVLLCPGFDMKGKYNLNGRLLQLPIEGNGNFSIKTKKYRLEILLNIELQPKGGKTYFYIKNFRINAEPLEGVKFDFENLFNGNKELAATVLQFANDNWKTVATEMQEPVFKSDMKEIVKVTNEHLKTKPLEDFLTFE